MTNAQKLAMTREQAVAKVARQYELAKIGAMERLMALESGLPLSVAGYVSWEEAVRDQIRQVREAARKGDDELAALGFLEDEE